MKRMSTVIAAALATFSGSASARAQCSQWISSEFQDTREGAPNAPVWGVSSWDPDGPGPALRELLLCGNFTSAGGVAADRLARWNGRAWLPLSTSPCNSQVRVAIQWDPDGPGPQAQELFIAGAFRILGGRPIRRAARWNGATWQQAGTGIDDHGALAGILWDHDGSGPAPESIVVVGNFLNADGQPLNFIGRWDGSAWHPVGGGIDPIPAQSSGAYTLTTWDPDGTGPAPRGLVVGGAFEAAAGAPQGTHHRIAYFDGAAWQPLGPGLNGDVLGVTTWDPDGPGPDPVNIVAVGRFTATAGGAQPLPYIARWNGTQWLPIGAGVNAECAGVTTWDPDGDGHAGVELVACGSFNISDGLSANHIARWTGSDWVTLGFGLDTDIATVAPWYPDGGPPELIAGGNFLRAVFGDLSFNWARWSESGLPWFAVQPADVSLAAPGLAASFSAAAAAGYDDDGPLTFQWTRNGNPISDGPGGVSPGGGTVSGSSGSIAAGNITTLMITAVAASDAGAYRCTMTNGCGDASSPAAQLTVSGSSCAADLNGDGLVDFSDYLEFLNLYDAMDPLANFNGDGLVDFTDYLEFLNHYDAGC